MASQEFTLTGGRSAGNAPAQVPVAAGGEGPVRMDANLGFMVSQALPRYADLVLRGVVFFAANSAIQALSVNSATATGFILTNPSGSGRNLIIIQANIALASAAAGIANLVWTGNILTTAAGLTTHTTPLVVKNALISGGATGVGLADSAATVPTPAIIRPIGGGPVAASSVGGVFIQDQVEGMLVLPPGCVISLQSLTTAVSVVAGVVWAELPTT